MRLPARGVARLGRACAATALVWAMAPGCVGPLYGELVPFPTFAGRLQEFATSVDEGADGSIEASDAGSLVASSAAPGLLSTSAATQSAALSVTSDDDSVLMHCEHSLAPGSAVTTCEGVGRAAFTGAESGGAAVVVTALQSPGPLDLPSEISSSLVGDATMTCGASSGGRIVHFPIGFMETSVASFVVDVSEGETCEVEVEITASVTTTGLAQAVDLVQTVSVSVPTADVPECTTSTQCPPEAPICGSDGECGAGDEGRPGVVAAAHCVTPFVSTSGCSWGVSGSPCRGNFECDGGYDCVSGVCTGQISCASDAECPAGASVCTEQGTCSPHGDQGEGCALGAFCREGLLCLSNVCTVVLGEGEDCTVPATTCDGPFACFPSTGTCETPLPLGSSCTANVECAGYPADNSCNEAVGSGVCSPRSGDGGPCAEDIDCAFPYACDTGTQTCG